jgi:YhcN/YlaJ family sporulation lipoprotein
MNLNRRFLMSLTFVLIFSLVAFAGCSPSKSQEKPITDIEKNLDMQNGMGDNAYNYENKANRLYGYFGSENMNNARMDTGIRNPGGNMGLNNNYGFGVNPNYDYGTNSNSNFMGNNALRVLTGSQSNLVRKLESNCNQIKGVNDTTIVKKGNTCYVGCDLSNMGANDVASVKSQCSNKIKNLDPSITNVVFTSDKNVKNKLETMIRNVNIGRPARGFMNDLESLFR